MILIETASISERSIVRVSNDSNETKMNKKVLDYYFKKITYNGNINMNKNIINYRNETDQNNSNFDIVASINKDRNINSINISLWNCKSLLTRRNHSLI